MSARAWTCHQFGSFWSDPRRKSWLSCVFKFGLFRFVLEWKHQIWLFSLCSPHRAASLSKAHILRPLGAKTTDSGNQSPVEVNVFYVYVCECAQTPPEASPHSQAHVQQCDTSRRSMVTSACSQTLSPSLSVTLSSAACSLLSFHSSGVRGVGGTADGSFCHMSGDGLQDLWLLTADSSGFLPFITKPSIYYSSICLWCNHALRRWYCAVQST